jgi:putative component of toxin-antitoxin plasmid stabilization module
MTVEWTLEPFEADDGSIPFERFVNDLSNFKVDAVTAAIDRILTVQGIGLVRTEWLKPLGDGLHEFRVRHTAAEVARLFGGLDVAPPAGPTEKVLLRVFVHFHGQKIILLLGGYDKGDDPKERRQQREIQSARRLLTQFRERQRRTAR